MKFRLIEKFDETRSVVQEYMYDAMDELNNASLEEYIQWFKSELTYYDDEVEQAVTDAYIEACDYGMIKGVEKTRLTSELKEYIESHTDIIDDTDELMRHCPDHLQHELKIVLSKLDESLNEDLLTEKLWVKVRDNTGRSDPFYFYATNKNTLKDINTLLAIIKDKQRGTYKQQLNQDIVKELRDNYANATKRYTLSIVSDNVSINELEQNKNRIITITDRDLRKHAEEDVLIKTGLQTKDYLIHHKHKGEENNDLANIMLISRNSGDAAAHAVHKLLEIQGPAVRTGSTSVRVFEHNNTNWVNTFTVDITIR